MLRSSGDRRVEANTLEHLARFLIDDGRTAEATDALRACLKLLQDLGAPHAEKIRILISEITT
jgi:hypothetical protein